MGAGLCAAAIALPTAAQSDAPDPADAAPAERPVAPSVEDIDALLARALPSSESAASEGGEEESLLGTWLSPEAAESWTTLQARIRARVAGAYSRLKRRLPPRAVGALDRLETRLLQPEVHGLALQGVGLLVVLVLSLRLLRGRGDIAVSIEYPAEIRGTFSVRLSTRKPKGRLSGRILNPAAAQRAKLRASSSSRTEHHMISRETQFREISAGRYYVTVDGFLQSAESGDVLATHCEDREIRVRRAHTVGVEFDYHPKNCSVEVKVLWDRRPVPDARVSVYGNPSSMRFARSGPVRIGVALGKHTLIAGGGDRVAELDVDFISFKPASVEIDLANREHLLFTGCPPAVEPYLLGDVPAAARALEREGQSEVANGMLARIHLERDDRETAARYFEKAGRLPEAADLRQALSQFAEAGSLFERAGDLERAAEMYRAAGDLLRAGETYERATQHANAAHCFREAGDLPKLVDALEKCGEPFEAAKVAIENSDRPRAIRSLQKVTQGDPHYLEAANILAEAYQEEGHVDLAIGTIEQVVAFRGEEEVPLNECDRLAKLLQDANHYERAIEVLEVIRRRDVAYPGVATRIEGLRKQVTTHPAMTGVPASMPNADAFGGGLRYDILEELGRGGMGVVFKARDRRLGRVVALKRLTENLRDHPKAVEMFLREARAAAALNHPNIVTIYDAGQEGDTFYLTMECLEGLPLQTILKRQGRLTSHDAARLGVQIAAGLHYAEEQRIVHRDIKTANLFFTWKKVIKIMDFGLAKIVEEVRRASTMIGGTPYYMAPEQSLGAAVDHRADLYALGVTFFELISGNVPFREGDVAYHHRHTPPPDVRESVPETPAAFAELILGLMAKKPEDRIASAAEVGERLQGILRVTG
ncbi:MAG: protein kinase [Myxococcales bacterium]|nr:protein kinase [Myxococcales bacterium]